MRARQAPPGAGAPQAKRREGCPVQRARLVAALRVLLQPLVGVAVVLQGQAGAQQAQPERVVLREPEALLVVVVRQVLAARRPTSFQCA